jgi:hypothetical protein
LLQRLSYLNFSGSVQKSAFRILPTDLILDSEIRRRVERCVVASAQSPGEEPRIDIFDRPLFRTRVSRRHSLSSLPGNERVTAFPSALAAVHDLSFNSAKVRHLDKIDDILIANNIAQSANGNKAESYNFIWTWQDEVAGNESKLDPVRSIDTVTTSSGGMNTALASLFELGCCGALETK